MISDKPHLTPTVQEELLATLGLLLELGSKAGNWPSRRSGIGPGMNGS